jgi:hypothetical protein
MKGFWGSAAKVAACSVLLGAAVALLAGKDDIQRFRRIQRM